MSEINHGDIFSAIGRLGAQFDSIDKRLSNVETKVEKLSDIASMGSGSLKTILKMGALISGAIGLGVGVSELWKR